MNVSRNMLFFLLILQIDFDSDFGDFGVFGSPAMSLDNSLSTRAWPLSMDQFIPTPPRSPLMEPDELLGLGSPFPSAQAMVNPNSILDESSHHRESDSALDAINFGLPLLDDIDIKLENLDSYLIDEDFAVSDNLCSHGFSTAFCNNCFDDAFKTEIVNDCMWGTTASLEDKKPLISTTPMPADPMLASQSIKTEVPPDPPQARLRFDSTSSRYSDIADPIGVAMPTIDSDLHYSAPRLETPSESSDTDTDVDETPHPAENVHLDHNYHFSHHSHKADIASPLMKALHKVSMAQADSGAFLSPIYYLFL